MMMMMMMTTTMMIMMMIVMVGLMMMTARMMMMMMMMMIVMMGLMMMTTRMVQDKWTFKKSYFNPIANINVICFFPPSKKIEFIPSNNFQNVIQCKQHEILLNYILKCNIAEIFYNILIFHF